MVALTIVSGLAVGLAAYAIATSRDRHRGLALGYAATSAGVTWATSAIVVGNRGDEMSGMFEIVVGGLLLWFVVLPAGLYVALAEWRAVRRVRD